MIWHGVTYSFAIPQQQGFCSVSKRLVYYLFSNKLIGELNKYCGKCFLCKNSPIFLVFQKCGNTHTYYYHTLLFCLYFSGVVQHYVINSGFWIEMTLTEHHYIWSVASVTEHNVKQYEVFIQKNTKIVIVSKLATCTKKIPKNSKWCRDKFMKSTEEIILVLNHNHIH